MSPFAPVYILYCTNGRVILDADFIATDCADMLISVYPKRFPNNWGNSRIIIFEFIVLPFFYLYIHLLENYMKSLLDVNLF